MKLLFNSFLNISHSFDCMHKYHVVFNHQSNYLLVSKVCLAQIHEFCHVWMGFGGSDNISRKIKATTNIFLQDIGTIRLSNLHYFQGLLYVQQNIQGKREFHLANLAHTSINNNLSFSCLAPFNNLAILNFKRLLMFQF
jgi:hypothetical protein